MDSFGQTDWNSAYGNVTTELEGWVQSIEGTIPRICRGISTIMHPPGQLEHCAIGRLHGHVERHRCVWMVVAQRETGNAPCSH